MHAVDIRVRIAIVLGLALLCIFLVYPIDESINLGLDLRGGIHIVMRVKTNDALKAEIDLSSERIRSALTEKGIAPESIEQDGTDAVVVSGIDEERLDEARSTIREQFPQFTVSAAGSGGLRMALRAEEISAIRDSTVRQALETIRNRVDKFGVSEPTIQRQGVGPDADRILIQLPGVDDPERVKDLIGSPAYLEWKIVKIPPGITVEQFNPPPSAERLVALFGGTLPDDVEILPQDSVLDDGTEVTVYYPVSRMSPITGNDLKNSRRDQDRFGSPAVNFLLTADAGRRFQDLTRANQGQLLAIVLDRKIISAPRINAVIAEQGILPSRASSKAATSRWRAPKTWR
jgi:preprotein translocase subunit SecD